MFNSIVRHFTLFLLVLESSFATKWLIDNPGYDSPDAWVRGHLPCSLDDVLFPSDYSALLPLPPKVDVHGFDLPRDGALLLPADGQIVFGDDHGGGHCRNKDGVAELKRPETKKWFSPLSWRLTPVLERNQAVLLTEKPPCHNEAVIIPGRGPLSLDLDNAMYLRLGGLNLAGSVISRSYLENLFHTDLGAVLFKNSQAVTVQYYREQLCGCVANLPAYIDVVCRNMANRCPVLHCRQPVVPYGSCCAICGAVVRYSIDDECDNGKFAKLVGALEAAVKEADLGDSVDFHVSYLNEAAGVNYLQAVVVDRDDFDERSVRLVRRMEATLKLPELLGGQHKLTVHYVGAPYNPNITFGSVLLLLVGLALAGLAALAIFAHYSPESRLASRIPVWLYEPRWWRDFIRRSHFSFNRFDGNQGGGGGDGSLAGRDIEESIIVGYDAECDEVHQERRRAFDNPMFKESGRERAAAGAKEDKTTPRVVEPVLESGNLAEVSGDGGEEQELTEIKLESSSDEEDDTGGLAMGRKVAETKE